MTPMRRQAARDASGRRAVAPILVLALAGFALLLALGADAPAVESRISTPQEIPPPLAPGPIPDLDLLFTAEVAGWIEPCG